MNFHSYISSIVNKYVAGYAVEIDKCIVRQYAIVRQTNIGALKVATGKGFGTVCHKNQKQWHQNINN